MAQQLTPDGRRSVDSIAQRYGISTGAVETMLVAVNIGGGTMAQFNVAELGGGGQWMRGGMTMVGNMFDHGLKQRVDNLCNELSNLLASMQVFAVVPGASGGRGNNWWPAELGTPSSSGGQNDTRYAVFPQVKRLAIQYGGSVTVYDTLDYSIGGVSQQQGNGPQSLLFSSQKGQIPVTSLPQVRTDADGRAEPTVQQAPESVPSPPQHRTDADLSWNRQPEQAPPMSATPQSATAQTQSPLSGGSGSNDVIASIEALAGLHARGILTDDEFSAKKAELLGRL